MACLEGKSSEIIKFVSVLQKTVNLKEQLDKLSVVESAADLNLKLMKWR
jgi:hypothetical protein